VQVAQELINKEKVVAPSATSIAAYRWLHSASTRKPRYRYEQRRTATIITQQFKDQPATTSFAAAQRRDPVRHDRQGSHRQAQIHQGGDPRDSTNTASSAARIWKRPSTPRASRRSPSRSTTSRRRHDAAVAEGQGSRAQVVITTVSARAGANRQRHVKLGWKVR